MNKCPSIKLPIRTTAVRKITPFNACIFGMFKEGHKNWAAYFKAQFSWLTCQSTPFFPISFER